VLGDTLVNNDVNFSDKDSESEDMSNYKGTEGIFYQLIWSTGCSKGHK
jgi:hypothetical protein